jgi:adenosine deaminase
MSAAMSTVERFIAGLPKAELHMHLEGSIEPELMFSLAERNGVALRWKSVDELRAAYRFDNLQGFLDLYYDGCRVLLHEQDFYDMTREYLTRAVADNVRHAEVFLGPQSHTKRGVPMQPIMAGVVRAIDDAKAEQGITCGLLVGAQRTMSEDDAFAMMDACEPWADHIAGWGLGGAEVGHPPSKFTRFFDACRERGYKVTAHAGEEGPAAYVREAVEVLKVDRIDHGNTCMDDPVLVAELARRGIPLTVCPLSNLRLRVVDSLEAHPLLRMLRAGLHVTVNSDDPSYFGGYVGDNYVACQKALSLGNADLVTLARNGFSASFLPDAAKAAHLAEIDAYVASFDGGAGALADAGEGELPRGHLGATSRP